jgi:ubiquinone/menaquinone biosynthesis C-methylase UbiE
MTSVGKGYKGIGMEGLIAKWYAKSTAKSMSPFQELAKTVAIRLAPGSSVLEVAPGPGYFAIELAKLGNYLISGLDISKTFVEMARDQATRANVDVRFYEGNASSMPFEDESFDFVMCRAAFKNFSEPVEALHEMHRVLAHGGRALIVDLRRDASDESIRQAVDRMRLNRLNALVVKMTFRHLLLKRAYTRAEFEDMISRTKFVEADIREQGIGFDIWIQKF